jgi:uncharacterized membrane protein
MSFAHAEVGMAMQIKSMTTVPSEELNGAEANPPSDAASIQDVTARNVSCVGRIDKAAETQRTLTDRIADRITAFCGSMAFVWTHVVWFGGWIAWNLKDQRAHFDGFPFPLLTLVVSLEAIFLSTFILVSENRQARLAERRSHLDLQINLLAEQENTKMLRLLLEIGRKVGVDIEDPEIQAVLAPTDPEALVSQIEETAHAGAKV